MSQKPIAPSAVKFPSVGSTDVNRLFDVLLLDSPDALCRVISALARAGETSWLKKIHDSGAVAILAQHLAANENAEKGVGLADRKPTRVDAFRAVMHLEIYAPSLATTELVDAWASCLGIDDNILQADLLNIGDPALLDSYIRRGASPNGLAGGHEMNLSAVGALVATSVGPLAESMLDILAKRGEIPMQTLPGADGEEAVTVFDALVRGDFSTWSAGSIVGYLTSHTAPVEWSRAIAASITKATPPGASKVPGTYLCALMNIAQFESAEHLRAEIVKRGPPLAYYVATGSNDDAAYKLLLRICHAGIAVDSIPCGVYDKTFPQLGAQKAVGTMLHAAVRSGNFRAVDALLDAGADPLLTVSSYPGGPVVHDTIGEDAFAIAGDGEARAALDAWRARRVIRDAVASMRPLAKQ